MLFLSEQRKTQHAAVPKARVGSDECAMEPLTATLLVMGLSTTAVTEANTLQASQPLLEQPHVISVKKPQVDDSSSQVFEMGRLSW